MIVLPCAGDIIVDNEGVSWAITSVQYTGNTKNHEEQPQKNWSCEMDEVLTKPGAKRSWKGRASPKKDAPAAPATVTTRS